MKKQSNLSRLLEIAGSHKYLTYASWVLSAISALIALVPFYYIWKIIKEVLEVAPDFGQAQNLTGNGWMAVLFAVLAVLVYIAGLMCSHLGAFRIATNLRIQTMEHIVKLASWICREFWQRKTAQNRQRIQRSHRNLSRSSASRQSQCHCNPLRSFGAVVRV